MLKNRFRTVTLAAGAVALALTAGACAATSDSGAADDAKLFVGFSNPTADNTYLGPLQDAVEKTVESNGGKFIAVDAKVDPNKQITDIQSMISRGVDVLIVYPLDPRALGPVLAQASEKGIKIVGMNADLEAAVGTKPKAPYLGQLFDGFPSPAFAEQTVTWVNENVTSGQVLYVGLNVPVPALERHHTLVIEGLKKSTSLEFVGRIDSKTDDTTGSVAPVTAALTRFPDLKAIVTYSDAAALGAISAIKAAGKEGDIAVVSGQLQDPGIAAVKDGSLDVTYDFQNIVLGEALGKLALDAGTSDDKSTYETTLDPGVKEIDAKNVDSFVGWEKQLAQLQ